jgi:hypothetical protein
MFRIRTLVPPSAMALDSSTALGELVIGHAHLRFALDLRAWRVTDYERQWKSGLMRLVRGAESSALMTKYRGSGDAPHMLWALWRQADHVYVQPHCVVPSDLDAPFDPAFPYEHVGTRICVTEQSLPLEEWRADLAQLVASALHIRWPFGQ